MDELVIDINNTGKVEALHFDEFDLGFLGKKKISRASEILFNDATQLWDIVLPGRDGPECDHVSGFSSYDVARKFEVLWLQACRKVMAHPVSIEGVVIAGRLREEQADG